MKSQKEQRRATKSNEKQQKATKSNKKQQRTSELEKPKRARKNQDEQRRAQKVQMETRLKFIERFRFLINVRSECYFDTSNNNNTIHMLTGVMRTANFSKRNQKDHSVFTMFGCSCLSLDIKSIRDSLLFYQRVLGFPKKL